MFSAAKKFMLCLLFAVPGLVVRAQIDVNNLADAYEENFNALPASGFSNNWTNNVTIKGWYAAKGNAAATTIRANDGTPSQGQTSLAVNLFSFGANNDTDRALGSVGSGGTHMAFGMRLQNNSGKLVKSMKVRFWGEQWRVSTSTKEHPLRFSYLVSPVAVTSITTDETGYSKVPYLNFITPVATGANTALNGNLAANRVLLEAHFRVDIPAGHEIMLKWFDSDDSDFDHALAIDDVKIQFFENVPATDECTGGATLAQFMKGVILDIPDEGSGAAFALPTAIKLSAWGRIVTLIVKGQYANAQTALFSNILGYRLTKFVTPAKTYYILAKDGASANHWGTYVFSPAATRPCVNLQAPHPLHDEMTGEQATYMLTELDGFSLMVAGAHRCLSDTPSGCHIGQNDTACDGQFRISDVAHVVGSAFQRTTEVVAASAANRRFVQLHGFGGAEPFQFALSNGTDLVPAGNDHATQLDAALEAVPGKNWQSRVAHVQADNLSKLTGYNNIQGRHLNNYADGDPCTSSTISNTVTGRFLHIEQYGAARTDKTNYQPIKNALLANNICNCALPN